MAISPIKKIQILGYLQLKEKIIHTLIEMGNVHISNAKEMIEQSEEKEPIRNVYINVIELEEKLSQLQHIINFTSKYYEKPKGIEGFLKSKLILSREEIQKIVQNTDIDNIYNKAIDLENQKKNILFNKDKNNNLIKTITPWTNLQIPIEDLTETDTTFIRCSVIRSNLLLKVNERISEITNEFEIITVNSTKSLTYFVITFYKPHLQNILEILKEHGCEIIEFPGLTGSLVSIIKKLETENSNLKTLLLQLENQSKEFTVQHRNTALVLYDHTLEQLNKVQIQENFAQTNATFLIEGWIPENDENRIRQKLNKISSEIEIIALKPEPNENPPIILENNKIISPFEFIITLFSRPDYREFDPTPLMAPFFILFFALCLSDGGYGIVLALLSGWFLRKFKPGANSAKLFKVMLFGGIITFFVGALTGGWFGLELYAFPKFIKNIVIVNPLVNPMAMLKFAFVLGIFQILFGIGIKGYKNIKNGKLLEALLDQGLWIVTLIFLVPLGYNFILGGKLPLAISSITSKGAQVCLLAIILTQGRHQKGIIKKLLTGITKLYNIVGYFGDVLSYARLLALGLATSAIAMAINGVAKMTLSIPYGLGYILFALIFILGHSFNLAVNTLGGFVHSSRLQFLEYFSKFFTGGGREFKPFQKQTKYSIVTDE